MKTFLVITLLVLAGCGREEHAELMREVERVKATDPNSPYSREVRNLIESERAR